jgi:hypothetical protein
MDVYQRRRLVAVLAVVLVLVLVVVAIAGGGDDEGTPIEPVTGASTPGLSSALSKDEFIQQGDDICEETAVAIANVDSSDTKNQAEQELELTQSELDQLRTLTPPEEDQATLDDFFASLDDLIDALDKKFLAADRSDDTALAEADPEIDTAKADVLSAAKDYGFKKCGEEGEPSGNTTTGDTGAVAPTATTPTTVTPTTPPATPTPTPTPAPSGGTGGGGGQSGGVGPG